MRRAFASSLLLIFERPSMPTFRACFMRSSFERSSYVPREPPFLDAVLLLLPPALLPPPSLELAMRAAFSLLAPFLRRPSYCLSFLTLEP